MTVPAVDMDARCRTERVEVPVWAGVLAAVAGGLVHVNGERVKPSRIIHVEDRLHITKDEIRLEVIVQGIPVRRGPAPEARAHYTETEASIAAREKQREHARLAGPAPEGRPDKHSRRILRDLRRG